MTLPDEESPTRQPPVPPVPPTRPVDPDETETDEDTETGTKSPERETERGGEEVGTA